MTYKKITSNTNNVFDSRPVFLHSVLLVSGSDAATVKLEDAAEAGSNDFAQIKIAANSSRHVPWGQRGLGVKYVSVTLTGTNAVVYLYYS